MDLERRLLRLDDVGVKVEASDRTAAVQGDGGMHGKGGSAFAA